MLCLTGGGSNFRCGTLCSVRNCKKLTGESWFPERHDHRHVIIRGYSDMSLKIVENRTLSVDPNQYPILSDQLKLLWAFPFHENIKTLILSISYPFEELDYTGH